MLKRQARVYSAANMPQLLAQAALACFTVRSVTCYRKMTGKSRQHTRFRRVWITPVWGPNIAITRQRVVPNMSRLLMRNRFEGFKLLSEAEGIIPALEAAHAMAYISKLAPTIDRDQTIVLCLSGRGDKDVYTIAKVLGVEL